MNKCPVCNGPLNEENICSICGYDQKNDLKADVNTSAQSKTQTQRTKLPAWGFLTIMLINVCMLLTIVDICIDNSLYSQFVTIAICTIFLFVYTYAGKTTKGISYKICLSCIALIGVSWIYILIGALAGQDHVWIWQYYMPILLLVQTIVALALCLAKKMTVSKALIVCGTNLFLTIGPLVSMILHANSDVVKVLILGAFTLCLLSTINLLFTKILDWKNLLTTKFKK